MINGPGSAPEILQGSNKQLPNPGTDLRPGMGPPPEMMEENKHEIPFVDPLSPKPEQTEEGKFVGEITLEMLPDEDLLKVAKANLTKEQMPKADKTTGEYDRELLIAALSAAGITGVENE